MTRENLVCIFAHPDDEAFGPAGTIYKFSQKYNVYILCATQGEAGINSSPKKKEIAQIRKSELLKSAKILGVKKVYFLGFTDGTLSNSLYHDLAGKIEKYLRKLKPEIIMTFEPRGISGHIDHIAVSMVTAFVFQKLAFIKTLLCYCIDEFERKRLTEDYFIFFPPGYKKTEINKTVDVSGVWDKKIAAIMAHESQKHDAEEIFKKIEELPKNEHFLVETKELP